jgi:hypothetical protein
LTLTQFGIVEAKKKPVPTLSLGEVLDALDIMPKLEDLNPVKFREDLKKKPLMQGMSCDQAIDKLYANIGGESTMGTLFYLLLNGWYLGAWGDYGSCLADATDGQFIMVTINGNYAKENPLFTRGAFGKYSEFSTRIGLCMPSECTEKDMQSMTQQYIDMAGNASWTNVSVSYRFASRDDANLMKQPMTGGLALVLAFIIIMMVLGISGTIIELTKVGDVPDLDYKRLSPASKFVSIKQYEPIVLQRKKGWAQFYLVFSALRNCMRLSKHARAYQVAQTPGLSLHSATAPLYKNLSIFNGLLGFGIIYVMWASTYFFSWYGLYDNP